MPVTDQRSRKSFAYLFSNGLLFAAIGRIHIVNTTRNSALPLMARWTELELSFVGPYSYQSIDRYHRPIDLFLSYWPNCNCVLDPNCPHESIAACESQLITGPLIAGGMERHNAIRRSQTTKIKPPVNCGKNAIGRHAAAQDQQPIASDAKIVRYDLLGRGCRDESRTVMLPALN